MFNTFTLGICFNVFKVISNFEHTYLESIREEIKSLGGMFEIKKIVEAVDENEKANDDAEKEDREVRLGY